MRIILLIYHFKMIRTEELLVEQREWESKQNPTLLANLIKEYLRDLIKTKNDNESTKSSHKEL